MDKPTTVVTVSFERYAGGYLATSKLFKGLFLTHKNLARVYDAVPTAIRMLFKAKYGIEVTVEEDSPLPNDTRPIGDVAFLAKTA